MRGGATTGCSPFACYQGGVHEALVVGDGGLEGFHCVAVGGARVGGDPGGGDAPVWDSAAVGARLRV